MQKANLLLYWKFRSTPLTPMQSVPVSARMTAAEVRASLSLGALFALRMLGLFLILPVFAVHAPELRGGDNLILVGVALGAYGLTQAMLQLPYGLAADRYGRKRVIVLGLILFAAGSFVAAAATSIWLTILGRCVQGAGAISAAVMALAADLTREHHRAKTMAIMGGSIGLTFALSLVAGPALYRWIGMSGIFALTGVLAIAGIAVTLGVVPAEPPALEHAGADLSEATLGAVLRNADLVRLNVGIFVLHAVMMSMFVVIPRELVTTGGLTVDDHWKVYLPVVAASFVLMVPPLLALEKRGGAKRVFLGAIGLLLAAEIGLAWWATSLAMIVALLLVFFVAFNLLEAALPAFVTRFAPAKAKATALGVYNTTQALGLFAGGALGGLLAQHFGASGVFLCDALLVVLWAAVAWQMKVPAPRRVGVTKLVEG
jgi:MFS family permease